MRKYPGYLILLLVMAPFSTIVHKRILLLFAIMCIKVEADNILNGKSLRMAAENWAPWCTISEGAEGEVLYTGIMANILYHLQEALNFTTTLVRPPDGAWGAVDADGNWGGMVGLVKRNEADFGLGMPKSHKC